MSTFLEQVADHILKRFPENPDACTVIFPNRRSGLFLKKILSRKISKPIWSPEVISLEDFLLSHSELRKEDRLNLIFELFEAFRVHAPQKEGFDSFYFWGEMLLRDFEEVDHYLVNPEQLFHYVRSDRQLAEDFYFLDKEQEEMIRAFWQGFLPKSTPSQETFVATWRILAPVYHSFKEALLTKKVGYGAMIYRHLLNHELVDISVERTLLFAGFNALTPVEEHLIKYFVTEHEAEVLWDLDRYYVDDPNQEAGMFLRTYRADPVLGPTFPPEIPSWIHPGIQTRRTGVTLEIGQAKLIGQEIEELLSSGEARQEEIVIVLPQDYMLFPMLNAIPSAVTKLNVTMGYPLKETPLYGLLEAALELQEHLTITSEHWVSYYHKPVIDILSHPYLYDRHVKEMSDLIEFIRKKNQVRVLQQDLLKPGIPLLGVIFDRIESGEKLATYLRGIVEHLAATIPERFGLEKEFLYHFLKMLQQLEHILSGQTEQLDLRTFRNLFRQAARGLKVPFSGEPVEGLQIMGALETRNLNFKYVFMLNMNEDIFPGTQRDGSFIPYRIRKAFDLPTFERQDAIYAYLFYRLLHHAKSISFYFNSYADFGLSGEVSRFLRQIEVETDIQPAHTYLRNTVQTRADSPIEIQKTPDILERLAMYTSAGQKMLSPSALNVYLDCRLQFYFKYVLRLFTPDELTDDLSPRDFGNVLHKVMELLYEDVTKHKPHRIVEQTDFFQLKSSIDGAIDKAFRKHFHLKDKQRFEVKGRNLVMKEIIHRFVARTLERDEAYAPFEIRSLENDQHGKYHRYLDVTPDRSTYRVHLRGIIDRVDRKQGTVRVIDYKSGRDKTEIESIEKLFDRTPVSDFKKGRNKAGFQTMYYAWLYASKYGQEEVIIPGILNIQELFTPDFNEYLKMNRQPILDARPYLPEFEARFTELLNEVYAIDTPFDQTPDTKKCTFCDFKGICGR